MPTPKHIRDAIKRCVARGARTVNSIDDCARDSIFSATNKPLTVAEDRQIFASAKRASKALKKIKRVRKFVGGDEVFVASENAHGQVVSDNGRRLIVEINGRQKIVPRSQTRLRLSKVR